MPSQKPCIQIRTDLLVREKFNSLAASYHLSASKLGELLILNFIQHVEDQHGKIEVEK